MSEVVNIRGFDSDKEREEFVNVSNRQLKVIDEGAETELKKIESELKNLTKTVYSLGMLISEIDESSLRNKRKEGSCFTSIIECSQMGVIGGLFFNNGTGTCYIYSIEHCLLQENEVKFEYRSILDLETILQELGGVFYGPNNVYNMNIETTNDAKSELSVWGRNQGNVYIDDVEDFISDRVIFNSFVSPFNRVSKLDFKDDMIELRPGTGFILVPDTNTNISKLEATVIIRWYEDEAEDEDEDNEENLRNRGEEVLINLGGEENFINPEGEKNLIKK